MESMPQLFSRVNQTSDAEHILARFHERAAQDASNIARNTLNVSFFIGGLNVFYGCNVKIVKGELEVGFLHHYRNLAFS